MVRVYRRTTGMHRWFAQYPNRVRAQTTTAPDRIWVGDLTYVPVASRWWAVAAILDRHSRRLLAGRLGRPRDARFTGGMLAAALRRRQPPTGLIFPTDRGSECLGASVQAFLVAHGALQSMTRGGAPDENALMESFFRSLKAELLHGRTFTMVRALRTALARYARYCNQERLHSSLGYQPPLTMSAVRRRTQVSTEVREHPGRRRTGGVGGAEPEHSHPFCG